MQGALLTVEHIRFRRRITTELLHYTNPNTRTHTAVSIDELVGQTCNPLLAVKGSRSFSLTALPAEPGTFVLFLSSVDAVQMSAAGVCVCVSPLLSLVCLCGAVSQLCPLDIDIMCKSMAAETDMINLSACRFRIRMSQVDMTGGKVFHLVLDLHCESSSPPSSSRRSARCPRSLFSR